jgi:hypothetical protein
MGRFSETWQHPAIYNLIDHSSNLLSTCSRIQLISEIPSWNAAANHVMLLLGCVPCFGFVGYVLASFSGDQ